MATPRRKRTPPAGRAQLIRPALLGWKRRAPSAKPGLVAAAVALLAGAGLALRSLWLEPRRIVLRREALVLPRWPRGLDGLRVGVLSDLHAGAPHVDERKVERVVARLNREAPDVVALLGDYVDPNVAFGTRIEPEAVALRLGRLRAPLGIFAVLGNHDWKNEGERVVGALRAAGITVLENEAVAVDRGGQRLWLAGLADPTYREPQIGETLSAVPPGEAVIALSHHPDLFPHMPERVALTLAGHTHGSQVDIPIVRRMVTPSRYGARFARGHFEVDGRHLFVSAGVGTSRLPIRFRAPPELAVVRLLGRRTERHPGPA